MLDIRSLILGIIQGATEILPISSSGHMAISNYILRFFGFYEPLTLGTVISFHVGSIIAIIIILRKEICVILSSIKNWIRANRPPNVKNIFSLKNAPPNVKLFYLIMISCGTTAVPILILWFFNGLFSFDPFQEQDGITWVSAVMLIINGFLLIGIYFFSDNKTKSLHDINIQDALVIGLFQTIGLIPGISRLGVTILATSWRGMSWRDGVIYSFLMSIPIILFGAFKELISMDKYFVFDKGGLFNLTIGTLIAGLMSYILAYFLLGKVGRKSLPWLAGWCWLFGSGTIVLLIMLG